MKTPCTVHVDGIFKDTFLVFWGKFVNDDFPAQRINIVCIGCEMRIQAALTTGRLRHLEE